MSEKADLARARFQEQAARLMAEPVAELIAVLAAEVPDLVLPDGSLDPRFVEGMVTGSSQALRAALSGRPSGPVN
jgi:hypothetical protein